MCVYGTIVQALWGVLQAVCGVYCRLYGGVSRFCSQGNSDIRCRNFSTSAVMAGGREWRRRDAAAGDDGDAGGDAREANPWVVVGVEGEVEGVV